METITSRETIEAIEEQMTTLATVLLEYLRRGGMPSEEAEKTLLVLLRLQIRRERARAET